MSKNSSHEEPDLENQLSQQNTISSNNEDNNEGNNEDNNNEENENNNDTPVENPEFKEGDKIEVNYHGYFHFLHPRHHHSVPSRSGTAAGWLAPLASQAPRQTYRTASSSVRTFAVPCAPGQGPARAARGAETRHASSSDPASARGQAATSAADRQIRPGGDESGDGRGSSARASWSRPRGGCRSR